MDASSKIQGSIHDVRLTYKYVSRILGTYHGVAGFFSRNCHIKYTNKTFFELILTIIFPYNIL